MAMLMLRVRPDDDNTDCRACLNTDYAGCRERQGLLDNKVWKGVQDQG